MNIHPLQFLRDLKSVSIATSENGIPYSRIIDVMLHEEEKLYFVTGRGKHFYRQLKTNPFIAITAMNSDYLSVRAYGPIEFIGEEKREKIFKENPILSHIYPGKKNDILDVFCLIKCKGELYDLSTEHPLRKRFSFGYEGEIDQLGYFITEDCTACGICKDACPTRTINEGDIYKIDPQYCVECGRCYEHCPHNAIEKPPII